MSTTCVLQPIDHGVVKHTRPAAQQRSKNAAQDSRREEATCAHAPKLQRQRVGVGGEAQGGACVAILTRPLAGPESGGGSLDVHECPPLAHKCLRVQLLACMKCEAPDHKQAQNMTGSCLMFLLDRIVSTPNLSCRSRTGVLKYNILQHVYGAFEHRPAEILLSLKAFLKTYVGSHFPPR